MFLVYKKYDSVYARDLNIVGNFSVSENTIQESSLGIALITEESTEKALDRFNDIIEAASDGQNVYDARKEVGYWKAKKPGPKPKPKAPAQGNQEPAPKK